ncbi:hypothetical protein ARMGADRAFT_1023563 [Armillaria gallica]|uniref:Uncharacterized protein n=1 Tax=Armillaria gallica TaxID=47427 RepID=A0A2H3ERF3_ARMGA|nr:hypothetical protein ARMGADRAFT_1023563 [Armillaria gallica]
MLIVFNWERHGQAKGVRNAKLSAKASQTLSHDGRHFRDHCGDYFSRKCTENPAASGMNSYIVGLSVESCWTDGTNGWCFSGNQLQLGAKQAKIKVKTEGSRGMHVYGHCFSRDMHIQIADFVIGVRRVGTSLTPTREYKNSLFDYMGVAELYDPLAGAAGFTGSCGRAASEVVVDFSLFR